VQGSEQLITSRIRPDEAVALPIRVRSGEGTIGTVFKQSKPFAGNTSAAERLVHFGSAGDVTHLLRTRSLLVIPLIEQNKSFGVLNIESPLEGLFNEASITALQQSQAYKSLLQRAASMKPDVLSEDDIIRDLMDRLRQQVAFVIDPNDLASTYYQILQASAQIVNAPDISAGLVLVRDDSLRLAPVAGESKRDNKQLWAVLAAKLGAFNSDPEWKLEDTSIAGRIVHTKVSEVIPDVRGYPGYRDSGTGYKESSELIVPLVDGDHALGVIGLVSPHLNTFTDADRRHVEDVAKISVYAIKRGEEIRAAKRSEEQLRLASELQRTLAPLFPDNIRQVTGDLIKQVRDEVSDKILRWACEFTRSQHGAFVILQTTPEVDGTNTIELVMTDKRTNGKINEQEFAPDRLPRWAPGAGYSGQAVQEEKTVVIHDVYTGRTVEKSRYQPDETRPHVPYIPYFLNARSEVATPLKIGAITLGGLDVEADEEDHFTSDYVDWIEFLARQAAFALSVIDRASKTRVERAMADLSIQVDEAIAVMRYRTLQTVQRDHAKRIAIIQAERRDILDKIIKQMRELTGAWVGRFLIELNVYKQDDTIDMERGRLYYLASSDEKETSNQDMRFFELDKGVSSVAFIEAHIEAQRVAQAARDAEQNQGQNQALSRTSYIVFNSEKKRHPRYFDSDPNRVSRSGIFQPTIEGTRVTGVLNLECEQEGAFTPELIRACESAGDLISKLMTGARLRIDAVLRDMLRSFDFDIMRRSSSDLKAFMDLALEKAAQLSITASNQGWGAIVQLRPPFDGTQAAIERLYWRNFADPQSALNEEEPDRAILEYPIFREAIIEQRPVVLLDRRQSSDEAPRTESWLKEARAVIAVPLISPSTVDEKVNDVMGLLILAHPDPAQFSDHDKLSLRLFAESIVYGLKTLAFAQARANLMRQLRFDSGRAATPSALYADAAIETLAEVEQSTTLEGARKHLGSLRETTRQSMRLLGLTQHITTWFLDLADDDLSPDLQATTQSAASLLGDFRGSADTFAEEVFAKTIRWDTPVGPQTLVPGGDEEARLIGAILAQYLEVAFRGKGTGIAVALHAKPVGGGVEFSVCYDGPTLTKEEQKQLFVIGVTPGTLSSEKTSITLAQQGLFQVRRIIDRMKANQLNWDANYRIGDDQSLPNTLYLAVPSA
jgi:GAF domain-containing protein